MEVAETNVIGRPGWRVASSPAWAVILLGLCYVGYFKGTALIQALPVDATLALTVVVAFGIALHTIKGNWTNLGALWAIAGLWLVFGAGAALVIGAGRGADKVSLLYSVTLVCALAPCFFLWSEVAQGWWLKGTLFSAALMAVTLIVAPDPVVEKNYGRLQLESVVTIGSSRVVGAGIVVAVIYGLASSTRRWLWWAFAAGGLVVLVAIGSRGPFLALLASIGFAVLLARVFRGKRGLSSVLSAIGLMAVVWMLTSSGSRAAARLLAVFSGADVDVAREFLLQQAWAGILTHPLGVGWAGFGALAPVQRSYGDYSIYPHNIVLEITLEGGWLAGALFVILVYFSILGYVRASTSRRTAALLGLGVYWILVAQTSSDVNGNRMTWATLALGLVLYVRGVHGRRKAGVAQNAVTPRVPDPHGLSREA